jgi:hypothetical protein
MLLGICFLWYDTEFSDASVCVQCFRIPGIGTSTNLVYTQVHRLFLFFPHSAAHTLGGAVNFAVTTYAKLELAVNTLSNEKSVKTTRSNTRFFPISKYKQDMV